MADAHAALWVTNAVNASGRAPTTGHTDEHGAVPPTIKIVGTTLPHDLDNGTLFKHLADLGYIRAHGDPVVLAGLQHYLSGATGFYIGIGAMMFHLSQKQFVAIRDAIIGEDNQRAFDAAVSLHIGRVVTPYAPSDEPIHKALAANPHLLFGVSKTPQKTAAPKKPAPNPLADVGAQLVAHGEDENTFGLDATANISVDDLAKNPQVQSLATQGATSLANSAGIHVPPGAVDTAANTAGALASGDYGGAAQAALQGVGGSAGGVLGDMAKGAATGASVAAISGGAIIAVGAAVGTAIPVPLVGTAVGAAVGATVAGVVAIANAVNAPLYNEGDYGRMRVQCHDAGGTTQPGIPPDQSTACMFPDGYRAGGYFPVWPAERQAAYHADQEERKVRLAGLGNFIATLKNIDKMVAAAKKQVTGPNGTTGAKKVWMDKIRKLYSDAYVYTAPDREAKIDDYMSKGSWNVSSQIGNPPKPKSLPLRKIPHTQFASMAITQGVVGAPPAMKQAVVAPAMTTAQGKAGVAAGVAVVQAKKRNPIIRFLEWAHLKKRAAIV